MASHVLLLHRMSQIMNLDLYQSVHGWLNDLHFNVLFKSISVTSGQLKGDKNERLCARTPFIV